MRTGPWTKEEEGYLRWAYSQGLSVEWTAKHPDRTVDATKQKASRLGLQHPRFGRPRGVDDLATRLRILLGEEVRPPTGSRLFFEEELLRFAGRPLTREPAPFRKGSVAIINYQPL